MDNNTVCSRNMAENLASPAGKGPTLQLKTQAPQTSNQAEELTVGRFEMYWERYNAPCVSNHTEARQRKMIKWTRILTQMRRNSMMTASQTGAPYGLPWRQRLEKLEGQAVSTSGQEVPKFIALMQANACIGPGLLKGSRSENFDGFMRRFERKYRTVIMDEQILIDDDDHLDGRAKSVF
ncbi:unnamed protein product [Haemonchus placei]|uniref:Uncharacterized protein n=1 Tax=Haemonchus placei TaxID=6290 RepID=A0A0N4W2V0_HAEPC|nr:unnamed protein product [Haemonchus placei]